MSLRDFKVANATDHVSINTGKPKAFGRLDKRSSQDVLTPLCTDQMRGFPGDTENLDPGEVLCNVSPGVANPDGLVVAGSKVIQVLYNFYEDRLYKISVFFNPTDFRAISQAFVEKYGQPTSKDSQYFQNGYGAKWSGAVLDWTTGSQSVTLTEGSGNGPAQRTGVSTCLFLDTAITPPHTEKPKVDF